jgi:hypothetical protein
MWKSNLDLADRPTHGPIADRPTDKLGRDRGDKRIPIAGTQGAGGVENSDVLTVRNGDRRHGGNPHQRVAQCADLRDGRMLLMSPMRMIPEKALARLWG